MKKIQKQKTLLIALIVLTLCFIWGNSMLPASISGALSKWVKNIINMFLGGAGGSGGLQGDGVLRKIAHASEFAVLGILTAALAWPARRKIFPAVFLTGLFAAVADETIQLFSEGRAALVKDIWIDFGGFAAGVLVMGLILALRAGKKPKV